MKKSFWTPLFSLVLLAILMISSCKNLEARKPVSRSTTSDTQSSIEFNKKLNAVQEQAIEQTLEKEQREYMRSANGFYYYFVARDSIEQMRPQFGDRVTFEYDVVALNGDTIYRREELSPVTKSMEQEYGIFIGMREALKLMQDGDEIVAFFPSYSAYGYYGDKNRIGSNVPFKSRIKLLDVKRPE
jgi:gliding motility-associated peptidyl-prolyl isomerase